MDKVTSRTQNQCRGSSVDPTMASAYGDNQDEPACDNCGAPASWADKSPSNLTWNESLSHHLNTYLLSPRMWPIGYILRSAYSPLQVEREMPDRVSWRDAFEDLLALESGGQMISLESRNKESKVAKRLWHDSLSRDVSVANDQLQLDAKSLGLLKRMRDLFARRNQADALEGIKQNISAQEESSKQTIAFGKGRIADLAKGMEESWPASRYKMRGQWMASLVSSGALPGWYAQIFDSAEGFQVSLGKNGGDRDDDSQSMTEEELHKQFMEGIPMKIGSPTWSTAAGRYPEPEIIQEEVGDGISTRYVRFPYRPLRPLILSQFIKAECSKSEKGSLSIKVALENHFTDGTTEQKEIVNDSSKVLEENDKVYASMHARFAAVGAAVQGAHYDMMERTLEAQEEIDELV